MADNSLITGQNLLSNDGRSTLDFLEKKIIEIDAAMQKMVVTAQGLSKALVATKTTTGSEADRKKIEQLSKEIEKLKNAYQGLEVQKKKAVKLTELEKEANRQATQEERARAKVTLSAAGSYQRLSAEMGLNLLLQKKVNTSTKEGRVEHLKLTQAIKQQQAQLKALDAQNGIHVRNVGDYTGAIGGLLEAVKQLAAAYIGLSAAQNAVNVIFNQTKALNSLDKAYLQVLGSEEKAGKAKQFLSDVSERLGLSLLDASEGYLRFRVAADGANLSADTTNEIFEKVARAASFIGLNTQDLDGVFRALEQILSKGTVQAEELRGQLGDRLPGAFNIMAKALGVTTLELNKMLKAGEILANDALPKFADQLEKTFNLQGVDRVDNLAAAQARFGRAITLVIQKLDASGAFKSFFDLLTKGVTFIGNNLSTIFSLGKAVLYLASAWTAWKLSMAAANSTWLLSLRLGVLDITQKGLQATATAALTAAQRALNAAVKANPIGLILTAAIALVGVIDFLNDKVKETKKLQNDLGEAARKASAEVIFQKFQIDNLVKAYADEKTSLEEKKTILTQLKNLGVDIVDSNNDQKISIDELTASTNDYIRALEIRIKNEVLLDKLKAAIAEREDVQGKLNKQKINPSDNFIDRAFGTGASKFIDRAFGADLTLEGKQKKVDELTKYITEIEKEVQQNIDSLGVENTTTKTPPAPPSDKDPILEELKRQKALNDLRLKNQAQQIKDAVLTNAILKRENDIALRNGEISQKQHNEALLVIEQNLRDKKTDILNESIDAEDKVRTDQERKERDAEKARLDAIANSAKARLAADEEAKQSFVKTFLEERDAQREFNQLVFDSETHTQQEINDQKLKDEIQYLQDRLDANKIYGGLLTDEEIAQIEKVIAFKKGQEGKGDPKKTKEGFLGLLGFAFTPEQQQALQDAFSSAKSQLQEFFDFKGRLIEQDLDRANNALQAANDFYSQQIELAKNGYANELDVASKRVADAKKQQEDALRQQAKYNKQQVALNAALEASNLAVGISNIIKASFNPLIAIPLIALMLGSFAASKLKAFQLAKTQFAEGGLEIIGGGTHAEGKDTYLGFQSQGKPAYAQRGEAHAIVNAQRTSQYRPAIEDVVNSWNSGTFYDRWVRRDQVGQTPIFSSTSIDTTRMEGSLQSIDKSVKEKVSTEGKYRIIQNGGRTTRIRIE